MCILLHRSNLSKLANVRFKNLMFLTTSLKFRKSLGFLMKFAVFPVNFDRNFEKDISYQDVILR